MPDAQFTVPYPEHPHFVGREEDLARLHAALQGEGPVGINLAAMGNPTGVTGQGDWKDATSRGVCLPLSRRLSRRYILAECGQRVAGGVF